MKKFAFILIIAVMSTFASAALASDFGHNWWHYNPFRHFSGTFEMSASGSCIHSQYGYGPIVDTPWGGQAMDAIVSPEPGVVGVVYAGTTASTGTWVFKKDGKGTYSYILYATVTPPITEPPCPIPGGIRIFSSLHKDANGNYINEYTFEYEITRFGDITITTQQGDTLEGSISTDKKSIILFDNIRIKGPGSASCPLYNIICIATRTLIKIQD
jgi:hypothetical protein